jgi:RimJ/RimL family protein N-acetyltransferase
MLKGTNLILTPFTDSFITEEYLQWLHDYDVNKFLCVGRKPVVYEDCKYKQTDSNMRFAIVCAECYIGTISLHSIDWITRCGEVGYMIGDKRFWGKGLATEAVGLVADYALNRLNLHKVEAGVVDGNIGSVKVLEKNGFKEYGRIPDNYFVEGKYYDSIRFYKLQGW